jgi:Fe-S cluster biogenesis protein NfuA|tara:strand:- start:3336 stop:3668 length:333 start_codon:yes stop_codon:yes gene_type:complete
MTTRTDEQIITEVKKLIESHVKPGVAQHGGNIEFLNYKDGHLLLELQGACSGCSGSTITLKMGVENMIKHYVPEIVSVEAQDGYSEVDPFYSDPFSMQHDWDEVDDSNNK